MKGKIAMFQKHLFSYLFLQFTADASNSSTVLSIGAVLSSITSSPRLTHFHTITPFDAPGKQAF